MSTENPYDGFPAGPDGVFPGNVWRQATEAENERCKAIVEGFNSDDYHIAPEVHAWMLAAIALEADRG